MSHRYLTILVVSLTGLLAACSDDSLTGSDTLDENRELGRLSGGIRVMTRNVYVGTDVDRVLGATSPEELPVLAAEAFQGLYATDFRKRAQLIAREIAWTNPHLIGLQEISTIRIQSPGDAIAGGTQPAETVVFDYLDVLLQAISAEGLSYRPVAVVQNADAEVPMVTGSEPLTFDDVRLTDFDVILARQDVTVADPLSRNYMARLAVPFGPGLTIEVPRGVAAVTASVEGRTVRFVNTHLEPASQPALVPLQLAQARELVSLLAAETDPVILVGDLNTYAPVGETYQLLIDEGFVDAWLQQTRPSAGDMTCCHALDLRNPLPNFDRRIDLVFYRGLGTFREVRAVVVGDEVSNRTSEGVWPSDHAGVVAHLQF